MLIEHDVSRVYMLCKLKENGRSKCEKYFPEVDETYEYDGFKVTTLSSENESDYIV